MASTSQSDNYKFKLESFEGPLDLLLFLIKKSEINIYDIPIATITEQYLEFLNYATKIDLENITEFYLMAATLLYIKSRMLLPVEFSISDDLEDPRSELVEKLIEYQKYRKLSELIEAKEQEAEWSLERKSAQPILPFSDEELWQQVSVWDLLKTFSSILSSFPAERVVDLYEEVTVNEKITLIYELLDSTGEFMFTDLVIKKSSIMEIICAFLALLELVKSAVIVVFQNKMFGDILVRAREAGERDEA
ncbi:MAG: segregation/condensation protein A [Spirochaetaceae bacterium]|nr:MAG: segregation/condensation protein A [Spirochaetaceae bacterium]